jgi:EmrB/QacA subfamily drug resistance transporter
VNTRQGNSGRPDYSLVLAVLALSGTTFALLQSLVIPALPDLQHAFGASQNGIAWVLTANLLSASILTPILGRLGDVLGRKRVLLATLVALAIGTLISALADSLAVMLIGRVVQGAGAGIFPLAFAIIRDEFPPGRVAGGLGLMSALLGIGGGIGLLLPGPIVASLSYHWLFWLPLAIILVAIALTARYVPESRTRVRETINWIAAALMSLGLALVLIAVSQAPVWGWGSPRTLALFAAGGGVLAAWIIDELHASQPLIDMRIMRVRGVWTTNLAAFLLGVGMYASFLIIPQFVETPSRAGYGFAASVTQAGLFMLPAAVIQIFIGPATGRIERAIGSRAQLATGLTFAALSFVVLLLAHDERWQLYGASAILGVGFGFALPALPNLIVGAVPAHQTGVATGVNNLARSLGGAFGGQLSATFIVSYGTAGDPLERGYGLAFAMCAAALVLGLVVCAAIPRGTRYRSTRAGGSRRAAAPPRNRQPEPALGVCKAGSGTIQSVAKCVSTVTGTKKSNPNTGGGGAP